MEDAPTNATEYSVSEISAAVKNAIEDQFGHVRIRGEVGRLSRPGSGHLYFDLKDDKAVISAVAWKGVAGRWRFQPEQGLEVIVTGRLTTFPGQSKYQIIVENVEPAGVGALMALLEERRKKLTAEGLFASEHKKDLPYLPRIIGVATSPTGAVIRDILHRLEDRFPTHVIVWPCRVQGESCAPEISAAVRGFNSFAPEGPIPRPDLIIVARGGGSVEDLWGFNEEEVVRAVAESDIPVISAVGHETDVTLIDYAADRRAPTPTGAAEMAVPVRAELIAYVEDLAQRQRNATRRVAQTGRDRLRAASAGLPRATDLLANARQRLDLATEKLGGGLRAAHQQKALTLAKVAPRLSSNLLRQRANEARQRVNYAGERLAAGLRAAHRQKAQALSSVASKLSVASLSRQHNDLSRRLNQTSARLAPVFARTIADRSQKLGAINRLFESLNYTAVLKRGYVVVRRGEDVIQSGEALTAGDAVSLEFADGKRGATITDGTSPAKSPPPVKTKKQNPDDEQSSLF